MESFVDFMIRYGAVAFGSGAFVVLYVVRVLNKQNPDLWDLVSVGGAGGAIPTGTLMIWGAINDEVLRRLIESNLARLYIALAGSALIVAFVQLFRKLLEQKAPASSRIG